MWFVCLIIMEVRSVGKLASGNGIKVLSAALLQLHQFVLSPF